MKNLTTQTQGAFDRIKDVLIHESPDDLNLIIENLEYLLVKARQIKNEVSINSSGNY